jgi:hypothetical protein
MAIRVVNNQAALTIDASGAKPDSQFSANNTFLFGHLGQGWNGNDWVGDAITCKASVPITGPQAETDRVELGFVQIARALSFQAFYAGRIASEGGIALNYFQPPALASKVLFDGTKGARDPWYRNPVFGSSANKRVATTGDHPGMVVRLSLENRSRSNVRNFLFHCIMDREFWTILTALEPGGKPQYVAHFHWQLRYEFKLVWRGGVAQKPESTSFIKVIDKQVAGAPTDGDLQSLLGAPSGERANSIGTRMEAATVTGNPPNRSDNKDRFLTLRNDFWT